MDGKVIILAGGRGKRLSTISKENLPKQFLPLITKESMLEITIKRAMKIVDPKNIYIITQPEYIEITEKQTTKLCKECHILAGPNLKSTTEAIAFFTMVLKAENEDTITIILPSDHIIDDENRLLNALQRATKLAKDNYLVTIGINPEFPETNYGYIEKGKQQGDNCYQVKKFTEKPGYKKAEEYYKDENYLWNAGIFIWKNSVIYKEFEEYMPDVYSEINRYAKRYQEGNLKETKDMFSNIKTKSIDYEILEKVSNICVTEGNFKWTDIGNLNTLQAAKEKDDNGNTIEGRVVVQNSKNNMIIAKDKQIIAKGIENLIIIGTEDEILIINSSEKKKEDND